MARVDPGILATLGRLIDEASHDDAPPPIIGVAGAQGSGKTSLAAEAVDAFGAVALSLDDVYLTRAERLALAKTIHPLFATRGPPGTHDLTLLDGVLDALRGATSESAIRLPVFDKLKDDRRLEADWPVTRGRPRAIILEGWCVGALPQPDADLVPPVNALERDEDAQEVWRRAINGRLADDYAVLFARLDRTLYLRPPAFEQVLDWRCEQEATLLGGPPLPSGRRTKLARFVQHYERLTRHMMDGGVRADVVIQLDANRRAVATDSRLAR